MPFFKDALSVVMAAWDTLQRGLLWVGDRISAVLFTAIYFTLFACVAIPYRLFRRDKKTTTAYHAPETPFTRTRFSEEW